MAGSSADVAWVRTRGAAVEAPSNGRLTRLLAEARWIVGTLFAVALFGMLVTYSASDPSFTHSVSSPSVANIGGRVGAWVADDKDEFVWILSYDGPDGFDAADARYYASPARAALDPDPAQWFETVEHVRLRAILPTD